MRSVEDVLATLDERGSIDGLPFMPEMLKYCGREMEIFRSAHKTCDTVAKTGNTRGMAHAYHLVDARCDGSAHDGCEARCMHFWKDEWLESLDGAPLGVHVGGPRSQTPVTTETLDQASRGGQGENGETLYRCSATEMLRATEPLAPFAMHQYVQDVRTGNATAVGVAKTMAITLFNKYQGLSLRFLPAALRIKDGLPYPYLEGKHEGPKSVPAAGLDLAVGERVRVRSRSEIVPQLNKDLTNRGLRFDIEMLDQCGDEFTVSRHVQRIIDEPSGRMITLKDCVVLDGVFCDGRLHRFCPRTDPLYWREGWLERVPDPSRPQ